MSKRKTVQPGVREIIVFESSPLCSINERLCLFVQNNERLKNNMRQNIKKHKQLTVIHLQV